ncbi:MAG: hypothetical protein ACRD3S_08095, partial [Terracidiphilus sp.]
GRFVRTLLIASPVEAGYLATDQVVFEPDNLLKLMAKHSIQVKNVWQLACEAQGGESIAELLEAALGDWVDFCFVSVPASIAIYADHDEYVTFYAGDESTLVKITSRLEEAAFSPVADYVRPYCGEYSRS